MVSDLLASAKQTQAYGGLLRITRSAQKGLVTGSLSLALIRSEESLCLVRGTVTCSWWCCHSTGQAGSVACCRIVSYQLQPAMFATADALRPNVSELMNVCLLRLLVLLVVQYCAGSYIAILDLRWHAHMVNA
jgi:hypothetical protein